MVGRPACCRCRCALEAQSLQLELVDERIDDAHRVVFTDVVVETLGQQGDLASVLSLDESLHVTARVVALPRFCRARSGNQSVFTRPRPVAVSHALVKRTFAASAERLLLVAFQQTTGSPRPPAPVPISESQ